MIANLPEKPRYDRIMRLEMEKKERADDIKAEWESAKGALDKEQLARLKMAVKRALADRDKLDAQRKLEDEADDLIKALGPFADTPMGRAALDAAQ